MKFINFAKYLAKLESTASRNDMVVILAELLKQLEENEIGKALYLIDGRVAPRFESLEFNFSTKLILRAVSELENKSIEEVTAVYKEQGDIGLVCEMLISSGEGTLSISDVFLRLEVLAKKAGKDSQAAKIQYFKELAKQTSSLEIRYIARMITGNMRLGLSTKTLLDALSWAIDSTKEHREKLDYVYGVRTDIGYISELVLSKGIEGIEHIKTCAGVPVQSKLVEREKDAESILKRFSPALIQPKYDGIRFQVHFKKSGFSQEKKHEQIEQINGSIFDSIDENSDILSASNPSAVFADNGINDVRIFSRNLEDMTAMFPDLIREIRTMPVNEVILDSEAVGIDQTTGKFLPFQETIKRKRKHDVEKYSKSTPLTVFVFDILSLNGKDLLEIKLEQRLKILKDLLKKKEFFLIKLAQTTEVHTTKEFEKIFDKYVKEGLEGVIAKNKDSYYLPGTRNFDWIKLKFTSKTELADTLDVIVMGYYKGEGARAKFGIGAMLLGVYDRENDNFVSIAKLGTGIKDEEWATFKKELDQLRSKDIPKNYSIDKTLMPDVFIKPEIVAVVEADSITRSKIHGSEKSGTGFSIRFPRLKQFGRDKRPEDVTTVKELEEMYRIQGGKL